MQVKANTIHFPCKKKMATEDSDRDTANPTLSFLDLPDLVLECILRKLPPSGLLTMSRVCKSLRRICTSNHMWESHMERKWGKLLGPAMEKERRIYLGSKDDGHRKCEVEFDGHRKQKGLMMVLTRAVSAVWPCSWVRRGDSMGNWGAEQRSCLLADDSVVYWYFSLENGRFWFPAQVYNRENGHAGFILSCYDAEVCYDSQTDTFKARCLSSYETDSFRQYFHRCRYHVVWMRWLIFRYPPHGRRAMTLEAGVIWERVRPPPTEISNPPHDLHLSDCLKDLRPGDSVEIQWRRNKEFPYGWWYGVIGHLESCDLGSRNLCHCHDSDDVVLEFNQYSPDSQWRRAKINRRNHREEGNEANGFYGGIRKLTKKEEISAWKNLWPDELLE